MDLKEAQVAAAAMKRKLLTINFSTPLRSETGKGIRHLLWMITQIMCGALSEHKAMRWLGYVQGYMVAVDWMTLEEAKNVSKNAVATPRLSSVVERPAVDGDTHVRFVKPGRSGACGMSEGDTVVLPNGRQGLAGEFLQDGECYVFFYDTRQWEEVKWNQLQKL